MKFVSVRVVGGKYGSIVAVLKECAVRMGVQQGSGHGGVVDSIGVKMIDRIDIRRYPIEQ